MTDQIDIALFSRHDIDVSRETVEKFIIYQRLLKKWQKAINLVGPATLEETAVRHFLDSAQMISHIPDRNITLADLGSGAGFPGLVLAMMGVTRVHLIESDIRKATFLREVSRETSTPVTVHDKRVESCTIDNIDLVTARALAPLRDLLTYVAQLETDGHTIRALFLKGGNHAEELEKARKQWHFEAHMSPSLTDPSACVLSLSNISRK